MPFTADRAATLNSLNTGGQNGWAHALLNGPGPCLAGVLLMKLDRDFLYLAAIAALLIATMLPGIG